MSSTLRPSVRVRCPSDKSVTHRLIILGALGHKPLRILDPLNAADCRATMSGVALLGAKCQLREEGAELWVYPPTQPQVPVGVLDCGNSGTTCRLLLGLFSGIAGSHVRFEGDASLQKRPMKRVLAPLQALGAEFKGEDLNHLPLVCFGQRLQYRTEPIEISVASAQVKTAILLAAMMGDTEVSIRLPAGSRDHTERLFSVFPMGELRVHEANGWENLQFKPTKMALPLSPDEVQVPGDPSSAAFLVVASLLDNQRKVMITGVMTNPTRTVLVRLLQQVSPQRLQWQENGEVFAVAASEPVADLVLIPGEPLPGLTILAQDVPGCVDEIPILAVLAALSCGPSRFCGLGELRHKESNRLEKTKELLHCAAVPCKIEGDDLAIEGAHDRQIPGFRFDSEGDHRMAMAALVLARYASQPCEIQGVESVDVSFPDFFTKLSELSA